MKNYHITVENKLTNEITTADVRSECAMWNWMRRYRNATSHDAVKAGVHALIKDDDGKLFKDITFRLNSKGKIELPNIVAETNRKRKVEKKTDAEQTIENLVDELGCNSDESDVIDKNTDFDPNRIEKAC